MKVNNCHFQTLLLLSFVKKKGKLYRISVLQVIKVNIRIHCSAENIILEK